MLAEINGLGKSRSDFYLTSLGALRGTSPFFKILVFYKKKPPPRASSIINRVPGQSDPGTGAITLIIIVKPSYYNRL